MNIFQWFTSLFTSTSTADSSSLPISTQSSFFGDRLHYLHFQCQNLASWQIQCKRPGYNLGEKEIQRRQYSFTWITSKIINLSALQKGINIKSSNYCTYTKYAIFNFTYSSPQRPHKALKRCGSAKFILPSLFYSLSHIT